LIDTAHHGLTLSVSVLGGAGCGVLHGQAGHSKEYGARQSAQAFQPRSGQGKTHSRLERGG